MIIYMSFMPTFYKSCFLSQHFINIYCLAHINNKIKYMHDKLTLSHIENSSAFYAY